MNINIQTRKALIEVIIYTEVLDTVSEIKNRFLSFVPCVFLYIVIYTIVAQVISIFVLNLPFSHTSMIFFFMATFLYYLLLSIYYLLICVFLPLAILSINIDRLAFLAVMIFDCIFTVYQLMNFQYDNLGICKSYYQIWLYSLCIRWYSFWDIFCNIIRATTKTHIYDLYEE